tara:strand:- start:505 stop:981 length:477 start_codon:yes stop_codon:yes gene_type:complete
LVNVYQSGLRVWLLLLAAVVCLPGCGMLPKIFLDIETKTVAISASTTANQGFPVALDIILVNDTLLMDTVKDLSAKNWFKGRDQFINTNTTALSVISREVVPGEIAPIVELPRSKRANAKSIFVFAKFLVDGNHRLRVDAFEKPKIILTGNLMRLVQE